MKAYILIEVPEDAVELVEKVRYATVDQASFVKYLLPKEQAAALLAAFAKRVPRAMLDEIYDAGRSFEQGAVCPFISDIAAKHGYKVKG
jgi:hypothetical protein